MDTKLVYKRCIVLVCLVFAVIMAYVIKLADFQLVNYRVYADSALSYTASSVKVTAARGEILDRYGRTIASNRMGYAIVLQASEFNRLENPKRNEIIYRLTRIIDENEGRNEDGSPKWEDSCPLVQDEQGRWTFTDNASAVRKMESMLELQSYATAQNCFDEMASRYETEGLAPSVARMIMGVRLEMELYGFNSSTPFTFAKDISQQTMQIISENSEFFRGVTVEIVPIREYTEGTLAPHLIGLTGKIYAEEFENLRKKGYGYNDVVGKFGVEKEYEDQLRGQNGVKKVRHDDKGNVIYTEYTREPKAGNTVVMTLDSDLQRAAQESIENLIKSQQAAGIVGSGADANAGAVVAMNVNTFEVLAAATYPSFNLSTYLKDYNDLSKNGDNPLFNRAINGQYAPGSTFKPAMALCALQEYENNKNQDNPSEYGIDRNEQIHCNGFLILEGNNKRFDCDGVHGDVNVTKAISVSCNIFFYTISQRVGIDNMNSYCKQLGLGSKTGVGFGEATGILAGREERTKRNMLWFDGDTLQAAIGQSDNRFTPMQICAYLSTLANGGTRYSATLIKTIKSYDMSETVVPDAENNKTVLAKLEASQTMMDIVKEGMRSVTEDGTASDTFENYQIRIGGKTGTADTSQSARKENKVESPNAVFIAFAPYENPEIAVAVIGEKCGHGKVMAQVARDIFDEYFFSTKTSGYTNVPDGGIVNWDEADAVAG
ncbi:MAG: hypothetical protein IIU00_03530 [Clostridia bacterium]|nr:hypothetical protein [Clostridia bacterium]